MFPILISVGPIKVYTFGLFVILAAFAGLFVIWKRGKELHYEERDLFDVVMTVIFWMFIGARCGYVAWHGTEFLTNPLAIVTVLQKPGWYFSTALLAGAYALFREAKKRRWDAYQLMDIMVTGLVLFQAIVALGSWFDGNGSGLPTTSVIGMKFPGLYDRRYPVQLWEAFGYGLCFGYLWWVEGVYRTFSWFKRNRSQASTGFLGSMYLLWWGAISVVAALLRAPLLVVAGLRFDVIGPLVVGVLMGGRLLLARAGVSWSDMGLGVLEYFGLTSKEKIKEQRLKRLKQALEKQELSN